MRLGISSYTYVWSIGVPGYPQPQRPMTAYDLLERATRLGVGVLQIADNLALDCLSESELAGVSRRARDLQIDLELGTSGVERERVLRWLGLATRFGSTILRTVLDTARHEPTPDEAVEAIRGLMPEFEQAGVILAIENHDRFSSDTLLDIVRGVGSPHVGICFDTANSIGCLESADRVLDVLGPHVVNVHIKDYRLFRPPHNKGFIVEGRPAGQGQLDVPKLLERVREFGRDPNVILELWPPPQKDLEETIALEETWAAEGVKYLRRLIGE